MCEDLRDEVDVSYDFIVDEQPIGRLLFRQFCEHSLQHYNHCNEFLDAVETYELTVDEDRVSAARLISATYLARESQHFISILNDEAIQKCKLNAHTASKDLFSDCVK